MYKRAAIRDEVISALQALSAFSDKWIDKWSDDPSDWMEKHLASEGGSMVVSYAGTKKAPGDENDPGRESAVHVIVFERSEDEGLGTIDTLEGEVEGMRITVNGHLLKLYFQRDNFIGEEDGYYQYEVQIRAELLD